MMQHLAILPILVPLLAGACLLLLERRQNTRALRTGAWVAMTALLADLGDAQEIPLQAAKGEVFVKHKGQLHQ